MRPRGNVMVVVIGLAAAPLGLLSERSWVDAAIAPPVPVTRALSDANINQSSTTARRIVLARLFHDAPRTLYCGCRFDGAGRIDRASCGYRPRKETARAGRVEIEHVVPAAWLGRGRACWQATPCRDRAGRAFGGRKCCARQDPDYRRAAADLHNLWPAIGALNARRQAYGFGELAGEARAFGRCDVEIDRRARRIEPPPARRGEIARIALYMAAAHGVALSAAERRLFARWDVEDPPDAFERRRDERIARIQGRGNPFVARHGRDQLVTRRSR